MSNYTTLKKTWSGLSPYNLNGVIEEQYVPRITMSLPEWQYYVANGWNTLYGSGGVIPSGTVQIPFGGGGVLRGNAGRTYGMFRWILKEISFRILSKEIN